MKLQNHKFIGIRTLTIAMLCVLFTMAKAQDAADSAAVVNPTIVQVVDAAKIDSFYRARNIDLSRAGDLGLYYEIYHWYHTCYRYGGNTDHGIDCSHFVNMLYEKIYGKTLGPSAGAILTQCRLLKKGIRGAHEGDILFFKIYKGQISHVGIYLQNNKFAHASVHSGVVISDMDEPYYKKRFYKVGRVKRTS